MGRDKALLPWPGGDLLSHAIDRLVSVSDEVRIFCGAASRYGERGLPVHVDPVPDLGPMGALLAALRAAGERQVLLLGVDLPLVPVELLAHLVSRSREADAVVPTSPGGPEPLCAVYGPACRQPVERAVHEGRLEMTAFWSDVRVREVLPAELAAFGDPEAFFLNVNDPADYDRAISLAPGSGP